MMSAWKLDILELYINSIIVAEIKALNIPTRELIHWLGIIIIERTITVLSMINDQILSFNLVFLAKMKIRTSTPPVEPLPKKVRATPAPIKTPPNKPHIKTLLVSPFPTTWLVIFWKYSTLRIRVKNPG